jgi:hypothetical protein
MAVFLAPKRYRWFKASAMIAVGALVVYSGWSWWTPWAPGRLGGLLFGTAAAAVFYLAALYPMRRRLLAWPLTNAQQWLQFHIYGAVLGSLFVMIHVGFALPRGQLGWWLLGLTLWTAGAGLVGVYLQKHIPRVLAHALSVEAIYERIPELAGRLQHEADQLVAGAPDVFRRFYVSHVRAQLAGLSPSWSYLVGFRPELNRRVEPFREVAPFLSTAEKVRLAELQAILSEKLELDVHYSLQRVLRRWVVIHMIPAILLIGLLTVHIAVVLIF